MQVGIIDMEKHTLTLYAEDGTVVFTVEVEGTGVVPAHLGGDYRLSEFIEKPSNMKGFKVDQEVIRTKGDYVVGRKGMIVEIKEQRARVAWYGHPRTWVSLDVIEHTLRPIT